MEYKKYKQKTICKNFIEAVLYIHDRIWKSQALGTDKQVSSSRIFKYNLLRKADILLGSLYRPGKVDRTLRVQELRYRKYILYKKSKYISQIRKERAKHDGFYLPYKGQIPRLRNNLGSLEVRKMSSPPQKKISNHPHPLITPSEQLASHLLEKILVK